MGKGNTFAALAFSPSPNDSPLLTEYFSPPSCVCSSSLALAHTRLVAQRRAGPAAVPSVTKLFTSQPWSYCRRPAWLPLSSWSPGGEAKMMVFPWGELLIWSPPPGAQGGHSVPALPVVERRSGEVGGPFGSGSRKALERDIERAACRLLQDRGEAGRGASSCRLG